MKRTLVVFGFAIAILISTFALSRPDVQGQSPACVPGASVPSEASADLISDCEALMASKSPLKGTTGNLNWWSGRTIDKWNGVTLEGGRVVGLDLRNRALNGQIPARLTDLSELKRLYLANNQLTGCVPTALRNVEENDLGTLGLPNCDRTGTPTPKPTVPPEPTATPTPGVTFEELMRNWNCTAEDFHEVYGGEWTHLVDWGPFTWASNGRGWFANLRSTWVWDSNTGPRTLVSCSTIVYESLDAAILAAGALEDEILYGWEATDLLFDKNLSVPRPQLGELARNLEFAVGIRRYDQLESGEWQDFYSYKVAASAFRRVDVVMVVREFHRIGSTEEGDYPPVSRAVEIGRRIDARLVEDLSSDGMNIRDLPTLGVDRGKADGNLEIWIER